MRALKHSHTHNGADGYTHVLTESDVLVRVCMYMRTRRINNKFGKKCGASVGDQKTLTDEL